MSTTPHDRPAAARGGPILPAVLAGVVGAVLAATLLLAGVVPALNGAHPVAVDTVSAESELAAGALVVVRPGPPAVGDVIAIAPGSRGVSLGVVAAVGPSGEPVVTSADGHATRIPATAVEGVYLYGVPWAGGLWSGISTPSGMFFLAALMLLLVAGHQVRTACRPAPERSGSGHARYVTSGSNLPKV
jgi:hypothetical protein